MRNHKENNDCLVYEGNFRSNRTVQSLNDSHSHTRSFDCTSCDFCTSKLSRLKEHLCKHEKDKLENEGPFDCRICDYIGKTIRKMNCHEMTHTFYKFTKVYPCQHCTYKGRSKTALKIHVKQIHMPEVAIRGDDLHMDKTKANVKAQVKKDYVKGGGEKMSKNCKKTKKQNKDKNVVKNKKQEKKGNKKIKKQIEKKDDQIETESVSQLLLKLLGQDFFKCEFPGKVLCLRRMDRGRLFRGEVIF